MLHFQTDILHCFSQIIMNLIVMAATLPQKLGQVAKRQRMLKNAHQTPFWQRGCLWNVFPKLQAKMGEVHLFVKTHLRK